MLRERMTRDLSSATLEAWIVDARERTLALVRELPPPRLIVPRLPIVNPILWEAAHVAWFQERWTVRRRGTLESRLAEADAMLDSERVAHESRWRLALPDRDATLDYLAGVRDAALQDAARGDAEPHLHALSVFHEDMHAEALVMTRQTLADAPPPFASTEPANAGPLPGDVDVAGGRFVLGAPDEPGFVFDNERDAHEVEVQSFSIARAPVTQWEFAAFVEDGAYERRALWSDDAWTWLQAERIRAPLHWRRAASGWERREFDGSRPLEPHRPMVHASWHEAQAFCRWAGRRLPTEAEWEMAASWDPVARRKRRYPWGDEPPTADRALLDAVSLGAADVGAFPAGDSALGCRQMVGNVWEWTESSFEPYPSFKPGDYAAYSAPWFGTRRVLRGGSWTTRSRLIRATWRNFYEPWRRDVFAGFRTCASR